ncbi:TonB-dependent siderophore receptor [Methylosarcina fibrata]|uniref:TonB-dependent siderophore receptor n=1 Tax=Methylosarcina fibrata TaxID=105972 RepID=UPI00036D96D4|nr:TonB-dependent receptor [Methylosarcina fibrata]
MQKHHRCLKSTLLALHIVLYCSTGLAAKEPDANTRRHFQIAPQTLDSALKAFSAQSGLQLFYPAELVAGKNSPGLSGQFAPAQALQQLLKASGLQYRISNANTVTLEKSADPAKEPFEPQSATLPAMTVKGVAEYDSTDPYNPDYNRPNATTATKTDTPIMETPFSIQVVPRAVINDQQAIKVEDVAKNVSGVQPGNSDGNYYDGFIVRGFDIGNSTYRNGFRIQNTQSETVNLERLEVLKGAAAMLYGRIQPGGMLNLVTKKPLDTPYYSLQQQIGSYDLYRTTLDATGPVPGTDSLLYRFNLAYQNNESFRDFINTERIFVAPSLTWKASPSTQFNVNMEYRHENSASDYGLPAVGNRPAPIPISRNLGEPGANQRDDAWLVEFTGSHKFNDDWMLKGGVNANSTEYLWQDVSNRIGRLLPDAQGNPERILERGVWFGPSNRYSQGIYVDLTGHFDTWGAKHNVLFGGDYYNFEQDVSVFTNNYAPVGCPINIYAPTYGCVDFAKFRNAAPDSNTRNEEQWGGVYFQDQITLWEKLHILGGGRYDWATVQSGFSATSLNDIGPLNTIHNGRFNPRVGVTYQPWQWLSVYGNYTESLGSSNGTSNTGQAFAPQTAAQYEGGIKLAWQALTANLAFYHLTKDNILGADPNTGLSVPLGKARSQGIEVDVSGKVTDQLNLIATYAFTDARLLNSNSEGPAGSRVPNVPEHQASFWAKYNVTPQFSLGSGAYVVGQRQGDPAESFQLPGYVRWDAMAAYKWQIGKSRLTAQVNVNNILDKEYYKSGQTWTRLRIPAGEPLSVLGSLRLEF